MSFNSIYIISIYSEYISKFKSFIMPLSLIIVIPEFRGFPNLFLIALLNKLNIIICKNNV